jgi:oligopeptidase B
MFFLNEARSERISMNILHTKSGYKLVFIVSLVSVFFLMGSCSRKQESLERVLPPIAKKVPEELTLHGHTRIDDYYWLKDRDNPEVISYLEAENDYAKKAMAHTEDLQAKLVEEFRKIAEQTDQPVPYKKGNYIYYERFDKGEQYPVYCRKKVTMEADEEVLIDANQLAEGHDVFALAEFQVSPEQDILAYGVDTTGDRDFFTFYFKDLKTGELLSDVIPDAHRLTAWANDNRTIYYVRNNRMYSHYLGTDPSEDKFFLEDVSALYKTKSDKYVLIFSVRYPYEWKGYLDASDPTGQINEIVPPKLGYQCIWLEHSGDKFYFLTDDRLMEIPVGSTKLEDESEIIFHQEDIIIDHFEVFKDHLVLWEKKNGATNLHIISLIDGMEHYMDFGESIYSVSDGQTRGLALRSLCNADFDSHILRYEYSSPTTPDSMYDYNMVTRKKMLVSQENMGPGFDPNDYQAEYLWTTAKDGTRIPISLVYRKGIKKDDRNPLLLDGYGMYGVSEELGFISNGLSLLNRGFIYAIAHVRGGGEFPSWHKEGMLLKKKNSFTDFITCARHLVDEGYTHPDRLFASGSSGGGLLIAGVITMAPEFFKGVIIEVPLLDIITKIIEAGPSLELGNPNEKEYYEYMLSYAPYENVESREYPNILITAGFYDTHVYYWPAAKFTAKLRAMKTDLNLLLLNTNMKGGHGGAEFSGRLESFRERAFKYAFILDLAGIRK